MELSPALPLRLWRKTDSHATHAPTSTSADSKEPEAAAAYYPVTESRAAQRLAAAGSRVARRTKATTTITTISSRAPPPPPRITESSWFWCKRHTFCTLCPDFTNAFVAEPWASPVFQHPVLSLRIRLCLAFSTLAARKSDRGSRNTSEAQGSAVNVCILQHVLRRY